MPAGDPGPRTKWLSPRDAPACHIATCLRARSPQEHWGFRLRTGHRPVPNPACPGGHSSSWASDTEGLTTAPCGGDPPPHCPQISMPTRGPAMGKDTCNRAWALRAKQLQRLQQAGRAWTVPGQEAAGKKPPQRRGELLRRAGQGWGRLRGQPAGGTETIPLRDHSSQTVLFGRGNGGTGKGGEQVVIKSA